MVDVYVELKEKKTKDFERDPNASDRIRNRRSKARQTKLIEGVGNRVDEPGRK
jgi:hypothetical protein